MKELSQADKIAIEVAGISIGDLPKGCHNFCILIWKVFNLGREYEKAFSAQQANRADCEIPGELDICKTCAAKKLFDESLK